MPAAAAMITNEQLAGQAEVQLKRAQVSAYLARDNVRNALLGYGVSNDMVDERVASLTDGEVLQIHDQLEQLPAGQGVLGTVLTVLVILILLDVAGVTDIFPGV